MMTLAWSVTVSGYWWLLLFAVVGLAVVAIVSLLADKGGRHGFDFCDPFFGCFVPVVIVLLAIIGGLIFSHSESIMRFGVTPIQEPRP